MTLADLFVRWTKYLWASPATLLGLVFVLVALGTGGKARVVDGVIEAYGGQLTRLMRRRSEHLLAVTLGHVVLGRTRHALEATYEHERVHVRQYERWGPLMLPMYGLFSVAAFLRGLDPYLDNQFEREAFQVDAETR